MNTADTRLHSFNMLRVDSPQMTHLVSNTVTVFLLQSSGTTNNQISSIKSGTWWSADKTPWHERV